MKALLLIFMLSFMQLKAQQLPVSNEITIMGRLLSSEEIKDPSTDCMTYKHKCDTNYPTEICFKIKINSPTNNSNIIADNIGDIITLEYMDSFSGNYHSVTGTLNFANEYGVDPYDILIREHFLVITIDE